MKPSPFTYHRAHSLDDAFGLLATLGPDAKLLAGGQSLMPAMNLRLAAPSALIDISRLPELSGIHADPDGVRIGAATRYADVLESPVAAELGLLASALPHVANAAVRNRGTLGGSLCHADPSAETAGALLALGAEVEIARATGSRRMAVDDFLVGVYETALDHDEVLVAVHLPLPAPNWTWFKEHVRRRGDFANAGLAACGTIAPGGLLTDVRLAFIGMGARAYLATATMARLEGTALTPELRQTAVDGLAADLTARDPEIAADPYRLALAEGLLDAALQAAVVSAQDMDLGMDTVT